MSLGCRSLCDFDCNVYISDADGSAHILTPEEYNKRIINEYKNNAYNEINEEEFERQMNDVLRMINE